MSIDTILGIIGAFLGVIGIITGYIFYQMGKKEKEPCYAVNEFNLIKGYSSKFTDLKIRYKRKTIENLTVTKLVFWNNGKETINGEDLDTAYPLKIKANGDAVILDVNILQASNDANLFSIILSEDGKSALISFDYLNYSDGVVLQVINTGIASFNNIEIDGKVKGVEEVKYKFVGEKYATFASIIRSSMVIVSFVVFSALFLYLGYSGGVLPTVKSQFLWITWVVILIGIAFISLFYIPLEMKTMKETANIPKDLMMFYQR